MKKHALALFIALTSIPVTASAQKFEAPYVGHIAMVTDPSPTMWAMSGMEMIRITQSIGSITPIMRTLTFDARTVEILSRTQNPPLLAKDIRVVSKNKRHYVIVRRYLLLEVMPEDARAAGMSQAALARDWAAKIRGVLPQVAPMPNRFGI